MLPWDLPRKEADMAEVKPEDLTVCRGCGVDLELVQYSKEEVSAEIESALSYRPDLSDQQVDWLVEETGKQLGILPQ